MYILKYMSSWITLILFCLYNISNWRKVTYKMALKLKQRELRGWKSPIIGVLNFFLKIQTWIHFMVIYRAAMTAKCESQYNLKCMFLNSGRKPNNLVVETALPLCNQNTSMQTFFTVTSGSLFYVLLLIWLLHVYEQCFFFLCVCVSI